MRSGPACLLTVLFSLVFGSLHDAAAQTNTYCVGDTSHLASAITAATQLPGTTVIQVQASATAYNIKNTPLATGDYSFSSLKLLGGYTDTSCSGRTLDARTTILDAGGSIIAVDVSGVLRIEGFTVRNFSSTNFTSSTSTSGLSISLVDNVFTGAEVRTVQYSPASAVRLINNRVTGSNGYGFNVLTRSSGGTVTIEGNTISGNTLYGIKVCDWDATPTARITNNIVWGNHGYDIAVITDTGGFGCTSGETGPNSAYLGHNIYGAGMLDVVPAPGSTSNTTSDPAFLDPVNGNYRLQAASPAINAGDGADPNLPPTDLDGDPRVVGSEPDIGAYETGIVDNASGTLTVTNTNDDTNAGSLRWAIASANASGGSHTIEFNLTGGTCPYTIFLGSDLPQISAPYVTVNGFSQPGSKPNTLASGDNAQRCIILNGNLRNTTTGGLTFVAPAPSQFWIQGIAFEGFTSAALNLSSGQGNIVWGNQFGGTVLFGNSQTFISDNAIDLWLYGSNTALVGGNELGNRNVFATASASVLAPGNDANYGGRAVAIPGFGGSNGNTITNNLIGLDHRQQANAYNTSIGIQVETSNNTISGNVIGNSHNGIQLLGAGAQLNTITNNRIGVSDPVCSPLFCFDGNALANQAGIYLWQGAALNTIDSNVITNNTIFGVEMIDGGTYRNSLSANSIYGNATEIDLNGFTYGYDDPASTAPNRGLNYPLLFNAYGGPASGQFTVVMQSSNGGYFVDLFASPTCDASGYGGGQWYLGTRLLQPISNATAGHNGSSITNFVLGGPPGTNLAGTYITATVTDTGGGNTSQFSGCLPYTCDVIFRHGFDTASGEKCP